MEDNTEYLEAAEEEYVISAIKAGVQSTEILNVLVITECVLHTLTELVNSMEKMNHVVRVVTPKTIQTIYTMKKVKIKQIQKKMSGIINLSDNSQ